MKPIAHLKAVQALEAAVRLGSFKAAAEELGVTPAAVGQLVRKLEGALGRSLLDRSANGFTPTEETFRAARRLSAGFADLREAMAYLERTVHPKRLHITVTPSIGERWLAPRLMAFVGRYPEIDLRVDSTPYVLHSWSDQFDYGFRYDRPGRSGGRETDLFTEVLLPVCRPEIVAELGPTDAPGCLAKAPLLHVDRSTDDPDWLHWEEWGARFGYDIPQKTNRLTYSLTTMTLRAMDDGHGLHLAQLSLALPDLLIGRLVAPFPKRTWVRPGYPYLLARLSPGAETALHRGFRRWLTRESAKTAASMDAFIAAAP